jgi:hypothetical protein
VVDYVNEAIAPPGNKVSYVKIPRAQEAELLLLCWRAERPDLCKDNEVPLVKTTINGGGLADMGRSCEKSAKTSKSVHGSS